MQSINYAGSDWKKWDLHIHSNASDGKGTPEEIINKAVERGISVIAITDHHTVKNLDEIKRLGKEKNITVISGIEFRTEFGAKSVHMIGLLPDKFGDLELNQEAIEQLILNKLDLSEVRIQAKGREKKPDSSPEKAFKIGMFEVQVEFKKAADLIHMYGGLVSVHAGDKTSSIEEMKHKGKAEKNVKDVVDSLGTVKEELMKNYIDICELGGEGDNNAKFYLDRYNKPSIIASDAHDLDSVGNLYTWIKADITFSGLKQIIYEPSERVKIQRMKPELKSEYQVIEALEIDHKDFGKQEIPFNSNMNAIIGGRSSGKSILLGCLARLANYSGEIKNNNDKYNEYITELISGMKLRWKDNSDDTNRKVEYFPQSYINNLASNSDEIIHLIEDILKGDEDKKDRFDLFDMQINKNIVEISNEIENYFKLTYRIGDAKKEIENIGDSKGIKNEVSKLSTQLEELKANVNVKMSDEDEKKYRELKEEIQKNEAHIKYLFETCKQLDNIKNIEVIRKIDSDIVGLQEDVKMELLDTFQKMTTEFMENWNAVVVMQLEKQKYIIHFDENRNEEIRQDKKFCDGEEYYKGNVAFSEINNRLTSEQKKLDRIVKIEQNIEEFEKELVKSKEKIVDLQANYYLISEKLCEDILMQKEDVKIIPKIRFEGSHFISTIENNFNKRGSAVAELLNFSFEGLTSFLDIIRVLFEGIILGKYTLKGGKDVKTALIEIITTNYFKIWYDVEYQGDTLSLMSEGKKAFIVLRMLLDFNENECPILIDQPEDDLDNRAIYTDLVTYIRNKKKERQIFVVTHNPNIVVGADAEEIIVANQQGIQNENQDQIKFEYRSGALENTKVNDSEKPILIGQGIREHVCDILEGGDLAFKNRESKLGFIESKAIYF